MKYILITLLSFTFATQITTKQVTISIDSTTEELNMTDYFELGTGYYDVELVYANLIDFECDVFESWGIMLTGLNYQLGSKKEYIYQESMMIGMELYLMLFILVMLIQLLVVKIQF